jgi:hypothetical protein
MWEVCNIIILGCMNLFNVILLKKILFAANSFVLMSFLFQASCSLGVEAYSEYSSMLRDAIKVVQQDSICPPLPHTHQTLRMHSHHHLSSHSSSHPSNPKTALPPPSFIPL